MSQCDCLIQFNAEPRRSRWNHVAFLPANGTHENFGVEAAPLLNTFQDQEIRRTSCDLNVRGADHRAAVQVGCNLRIVDLRKRRDFLRLEQAAAPAEIDLQDVRSSCRQYARK